MTQGHDGVAADAGHWTGHAAGVLEQVLVSAVSLLGVLVVARCAPAAVVGQLALAWNVATFFLILHRAIGAAFTVFVAREAPADSGSALQGFLAIHQPMVSLVVLFSIVAAASLLRDVPPSWMQAWMGTLLVGVALLYEAQRRVMWAYERGSRAMLMACMQALIFGVVIAAVLANDVAVTASVAVALILLPRMAFVFFLGETWCAARATVRRRLGEYVGEYWEFSRWLLLRAFLSYLGGNVYLPLVTLIHGFGEAGRFEIGRVFVGSFTVVATGLASYLLPTLARHHRRMGEREFGRHLTKSLGMWTVGFSALGVVLVLVGPPMLRALLSKNAASYEMGGGVLILAILGLAASMNVFADLALAAVERPELGWKPMGVAVVASLVMGVPLVWHIGVVGAFAANAITSILAGVIVLIAVFRSLGCEQAAVTVGR